MGKKKATAVPLMSVAVRPAADDDDAFIARAFRAMWLDNGISPANILPHWEQQVLDFLAHGREHLELQAFIAELPDLDSAPRGCAVTQLFAGLYPNVLAPSLRKYGYIWGVYVAPE